AALRDGAGFPMGPLELTDLIGQDVNFAVTCSVFNAFWQERRFLPSLVQQELVIGGRLGKKSGLGVYDWRAEREAVVGLEAVSDSFSPMKVEKKSDGVTEIDDVLLIETQGETAQALAIRLARPVVVVDKMAGKVVTIAAAAVNPDSATRKAIYYLQQQGKTVLQIADYPGMLIWRTVAMIINEALDALQKGVASEQDIDTAMRLGVNYPYGPLAWGAQLGWQRILRLLENLQHHYGEERYRPCSLLRQRALLESGYES
ncbi:3-hydroxybutyryl-CoA dehydrogenase, partial [Escherichia coli]